MHLSKHAIGAFLLLLVAVSLLVSTARSNHNEFEEPYSISASSSWLRGHDFDATTTGSSTADHSVKFPTLSETLEMAKLSALVYAFRSKGEHYCAFYSNPDGVRCHWYFHDERLGTQVMLVSNSRKKYLAVVFAGTDDLRTSLEDMDIAKKAFGNNDTVYLDDPAVKIHAGFDKAVFSGAFAQLSKRLKRLQSRHPSYQKVYTTGHSLGAANSILTATAFASQGHTVTSINFGCPRTGNHAWRDYLNSTSPLNSRLGIWKVVLGWDLVPRLPELFDHVGHTIQIWSEEHEKYDKHNSSRLVECYYRHYGDELLGYAGVPPGWYAKPYAWVPGAIFYHRVGRYLEYLELLSQKKIWVHSFKKIDPVGHDDDDYDEPPDDWYALDSEYEVAVDSIIQEER